MGGMAGHWRRRASHEQCLSLAAALEHAGVLVSPGAVLGGADHMPISLKNPLAVDRLFAELAAITTGFNGVVRSTDSTPPTRRVRDLEPHQSAR